MNEPETYRNILTRSLVPGAPALVWVMLNPSTADELVDDPTIRRVKRFTANAGYHNLIVLNLFAYRATSPDDLAAAHRSGIDIVGPKNRHGQSTILDMADNTGTPVVAAWGAHKLAAYGLGLLNRPDQRWCCLGTSKAGHPRHPLYLPNAATLVPWSTT